MMRNRMAHRSGRLVEERSWTDDELGEAMRLRRAGDSSAAIGRKLGRTRNSVVGALNRAGEKGKHLNQYSPRPIPMRFSEQTAR